MSRYRCIVLLFALTTVWSASVQADVYISELVASNDAGLRDSDGDASDWLELHNDGDDLVDLGGWTLSDGGENQRTWTFPPIALQPDTYLVVFASGKDRLVGEPHASFELKKSGESLVLRDSRRAVQSEFTYPAQHTDVAWGLSSNEYTFVSPPTPGASNVTSQSFVGVLPLPKLSHSSQWFEDSIEISVTNRPDGARIGYVATPNDGSADVIGFFDHSDTLTLNRSTVLYVAFGKDGWLARRTPNISTYLRVDDLPNQASPATFPKFWHEDIPADYGMDLTLLGTDEDQLRLRESMQNLPTISLVARPHDLYAPIDGIYTNPVMDGADWERPVSFDWFGDVSTAPFTINAGFQIQGRSSRQPRTSPKHSFRVVFKKEYGSGKLRHRIFEDDPADVEHNTLVLRATSNYSWTYPVAEQRQRAQYLRDPWVKATQAAMGHRVPRSRFAHLFLNGLYWGVYAISERPDDAFMATHFGGKRSEYDVIKGGEVIAGNNRLWRHLFALANQGLDDSDRYSEAVNYIDLDSFIDFIILNHFIGNETWDFGNWYAARRRADGHRFQFFCWDAETSMNRVNENRVYTRNADRPTALFQALRHNPDFRDRFSARLNLHLTNNGVLIPRRNIERYQELAEKLEVPLFAESVRWGDYRLSVHPYRTGPFERYTVEEHWQAERRRLTEVYFRERTAIVLEQYRDLDLSKIAE